MRFRVVILKDKKNKEAHASSAQMACEAAGAIRTVAALTREDQCNNLYSEVRTGVSQRSAVELIGSSAATRLADAHLESHRHLQQRVLLALPGTVVLRHLAHVRVRSASNTLSLLIANPWSAASGTARTRWSTVASASRLSLSQ